MASILVVDDEESIRRLHTRVLGASGHQVDGAAGGAEAMEKLAAQPFELVLCDLHMPGESGIDVTRKIRAQYPDTAVLMITAEDDPKFADVALGVGAYGYLIKPARRSELLINVSNALRRRKLERDIADYQADLERRVAERTAELTRTVAQLSAAEAALRSSQEETIRRLAKAAETRDNETANHIERMSRYSALLAQRAGFDATQVERIRIASPMHDIGKIGIPDHILQKPGQHTPEETAIMRTHAELGYRILAGSGSPLLEMGAVIAWTHHEKFDGTGYPRGLKGQDIPIEGRIVAIADVYDALRSRRVYKPGWDRDRARAFLENGAGGHFDPELIGLFLGDFAEIVEIEEQFGDEAEYAATGS